MSRHRVDARVGDAAGEHGDVARRAVAERVRDDLDLLGRQQCCDVHLDAGFESSFASGASDSPQVVVTGTFT